MVNINWPPIERACIAGMSFDDAGREFGVKPNTIVAMARRKKWPTPSAIVLRARELARQQPDTLETMAQNWVEKGEKHRKTAFELAHESLKKMKPRRPRDWREADIADKMARRSAGLENVEVLQQTLVQVNERINEGEGPVELSVEQAGSIG